MKSKVFYFLFIIGCFSCLQTIKGQMIIVKGGLNNDFVSRSSYFENSDFLFKTGFHLGVSVNIPFNDKYSFEPGLLFTTKGYKVNDRIIQKNSYDDPGRVIEFIMYSDLFYLDIPILFKRSWNVNENMKLFGAVGPYVGIGLFGRNGIENTNSDEYPVSGSSDWGSNLYMSSIDAGVSIVTGVSIKRCSIQLSYQNGFSNINMVSGENYPDIKAKSRSVHLSFGYTLGKK